ncbi:MAG TPA: AmmeMemoRadiSam system radical SAM enzyme [Prolixibacteraceae bacterium]|nr:AmmeMemoRadiSam system radical SAM enzyme [Prolixibacteraceae bacterium]HPR60715.1 AmmeMemoRadiSam system radical SAM enzyme [Prolixibacteraceae bacterium]
MYEASYYNKLENKAVQCTLCPRNCIIEEGKFGNCNARRNRNGILSSEVFSKIAAIDTDPIEKKPLFHFYPGSQILSVGTTGCNFHCVFCQNHAISQCNNRSPVIIKTISPSELITIASKTQKNIGIAFTYNEPVINFEYVIECSRLAKMNQLKTVMVSNGYINPDPLEMLLNFIDAFNIDLKGFSDTFYKKYTKGTLKPVLETIQQIKAKGKHIELTMLVLPTINDDEKQFEAMCKWISKKIGPNTVLHLSRYFPRYELNQYPTPAELLFSLFDIAKNYLNHVYIGNMATEIYANSYCPSCGALLIERTYSYINKKGIDDLGNCLKCNENVFENI